MRRCRYQENRKLAPSLRFFAPLPVKVTNEAFSVNIIIIIIIQNCSMLSLYGTTDLVADLAPVCGREVMQMMMPLFRLVTFSTQKSSNVTLLAVNFYFALV